eukprot:SAG11_NODE_8659_length_990_cov_1.236813_1_plen_40_part_10
MGSDGLKFRDHLAEVLVPTHAKKTMSWVLLYHFIWILTYK